MAKFTRREVELGFAQQHMKDNQVRLCKATLIEGEFWLPGLHSGMTWDHMVTFDEIRLMDSAREIERSNKNADAQHRRVTDMSIGQQIQLRKKSGGEE